jgi:hypothetical protein
MPLQPEELRADGAGVEPEPRVVVGELAMDLPVALQNSGADAKSPELSDVYWPLVQYLSLRYEFDIPPNDSAQSIQNYWKVEKNYDFRAAVYTVYEALDRQLKEQMRGMNGVAENQSMLLGLDQNETIRMVDAAFRLGKVCDALNVRECRLYIDDFLAAKVGGDDALMEKFLTRRYSVYKSNPVQYYTGAELMELVAQARYPAANQEPDGKMARF